MVVALLILGAFASLAVGAWYLLRGKHADFAIKTIRVGAVVGIVASLRPNRHRTLPPPSRCRRNSPPSLP